MYLLKINILVQTNGTYEYCQKCDTRLSLRVDEDGHVYVTSQGIKQKTIVKASQRY